MQQQLSSVLISYYKDNMAIVYEMKHALNREGRYSSPVHMRDMFDSDLKKLLLKQGRPPQTSAGTCKYPTMGKRVRHCQ
jgi:hypothetical protein